MLNVRVINVVFSPTTLNVGERLKVDITIQNLDNVKIRPCPPSPGYVYMQGQVCERAEKGYIRVGVNYEGRASSIVDHPYRWGVPADLLPGQTVTITGYIQMSTPQNGIRYWVGLVEERVAWLQDQLGVTPITVLQGMVPHTQSNLQMSQYTQPVNQPIQSNLPLTSQQVVQPAYPTMQIVLDKMCNSCRSMISSSMKFCPNCGASQIAPYIQPQVQSQANVFQANIIQPIEEEILTCAFCKGKGEHPFYIKQPCPVCNETGKIKMRKPYMKCKKCEGEGVKPFSLSEPCPRCNGKGVVPEEIR